MPGPDLIAERRGRAGHVWLNRPQALNALTLDMTRALAASLRAWARDPEVSLVVVRGVGGRAFCAGGDVRALYEAGPGSPLTEIFYREEYALNRQIFRFPKPYVALVDGIVMGGGVGISATGSHRVVTERTEFAMPETGIGLFPDVGSTYLLPRCPGESGLYLGLTGARIGAGDLLDLGLAEVLVPAARLDDLAEALCRAHDRTSVERTLTEFRVAPRPAPLAPVRRAIDACFGRESVEAILAALADEGSAWAKETLAALAAKSPTSLKITFRQLRLGRSLDFEAAMRLEFRLVQHFMAGGDFFEGVRAAVIDKDRKPAWRPAQLAEVSAQTVERAFAPLARELEFPD